MEMKSLEIFSYTVGTRVTAHVEFSVMRLIFGVLFDADHGKENRFLIRGLGEFRWPLKDSDSAGLAVRAWKGRQNPPNLS